MFRITVKSSGVVPLETVRAQAEQSGNYPVIQPGNHGRPLAVVGGGPSLERHLDELSQYADIWAINGARRWLREHGIDSTFFTVDVGSNTVQYAEGPAILVAGCHPLLFRRVDSAQIFFSEHYNVPEPFIGGSTSATRAITPALYMGYGSVTYFGCDGSFEKTTHVDRNEVRPSQLIVRAGGNDYRTTLQFYEQTRCLSTMIRAFPGLLKHRSEGLLPAMIEHYDTWEVVALSEDLRNKLDPTSTEEYHYRYGENELTADHG